MAEVTNENRTVIIPEFLTVRELAELMDETTPIDVIKELMANGIMASINQQIDYETAAIVAAEMGFEPQPEVVDDAGGAVSPEEAQAWRKFYIAEQPEDMVDRPPVVTMLGHVDHGKTSLLDKIRADNVQAGEAGGITQHIGAYQVHINDETITFLDTPGHEAFTAMRARGAQGADIAVLVVAADDGVMPQTHEAINHALAAGVPIVVALNKIDRSNARPESVMQQLADEGLVPDEWDGDTLLVPVSAITGDGIDDLLEAILLVADDNIIQANPQGGTAGTVLEAELEKNRGVMTTLLVQNGTLRRGDAVMAGTSHGRIKAMFDEFGDQVDEAEPSRPVRVMGLDKAPLAGTLFEVVVSDKVAREIIDDHVSARQIKGDEREAMTLEDLYERFKAGEAKELNIIVKADVQGSLEPIVTGLAQLSVEEEGDELKVKIIHSDIGNVSESDVSLASASEAIIVGFNVGIDNPAKLRADSTHIEVRHYDIIYHLFEDVEQALEGLLEPVYEDRAIGTAEVRQVFKIPRVGSVAGSYVRDGEIRRGADARVIRDQEVIHQGKVSALKRFQEDVREVRTGFECGINVSNFDNFLEGDIIQCTVSERVR